MGGNSLRYIDRDGKFWQIPVIGGIVLTTLYGYKKCLEKCPKYCPTNRQGNIIFGKCQESCANLASLFSTILDGSFVNSTPPLPIPTSTIETIGTLIGN